MLTTKNSLLIPVLMNPTTTLRPLATETNNSLREQTGVRLSTH